MIQRHPTNTPKPFGDCKGRSCVEPEGGAGGQIKMDGSPIVSPFTTSSLSTKISWYSYTSAPVLKFFFFSSLGGRPCLFFALLPLPDTKLIYLSNSFHCASFR